MYCHPPIATKQVPPTRRVKTAFIAGSAADAWQVADHLSYAKRR